MLPIQREYLTFREVRDTLAVISPELNQGPNNVAVAKDFPTIPFLIASYAFNEIPDKDQPIHMFIWKCKFHASSLQHRNDIKNFIGNLANNMAHLLYDAQMTTRLLLERLGKESEGSSFRLIEDYLTRALETRIHRSFLQSVAFVYAENKEQVAKEDSLLLNLIKAPRRGKSSTLQAYQKLFNFTVLIDKFNVPAFPLQPCPDVMIHILKIISSSPEMDFSGVEQTHEQILNRKMINKCLLIWIRSVSGRNEKDDVKQYAHFKSMRRMIGIQTKHYPQEGVDKTREKRMRQRTLSSWQKPSLKHLQSGLSLQPHAHTRSDTSFTGKEIQADLERDPTKKWTLDDEATLVRTALETGGDPNTKDSKGRALIHICVNAVVFKVLAKHEGLNISAKTHKGKYTALHCAVIYNRNAMIRELVPYNTILNTTPLNKEDLRTPLHLAVQLRRLQGVEFLLEAGATCLNPQELIDSIGGYIQSDLQKIIERSEKAAGQIVRWEAIQKKLTAMVSIPSTPCCLESLLSCIWGCVKDLFTCNYSCSCSCCCCCSSSTPVTKLPRALNLTAPRMASITLDSP